MVQHPPHLVVFFFNDTATTEIYTLSLHDALPISRILAGARSLSARQPAQLSKHVHGVFRCVAQIALRRCAIWATQRSEEHTSELQSRPHLVCRLLLEKKKKKTT